MANKSLFASAVAKLMPAADMLNRELAPAYAYGPEHKLLSSTVGSEAWNSRDLKSRPH